MKPKNIFITAISLTAIACISLGNNQVKAQNSQQQVKPTRIGIGHNHGVNISWLNANQVVEKVWLDNPSFSTLSFDGCVIGYNGCKESDAQIIHIKRIQDLKLKGVVPASSTSMTVVVKDLETGQRKMQFFTITKANQSSQTLISIAPPPVPKPMVTKNHLIAPAPQVRVTGRPKTELISKIETVMANPDVRANIDRPLRHQIGKFKSLLQQGNTERQAMLMVGLNPEILESILNFETTTTTAQQ